MVTLNVECFGTGSEGFAQTASFWAVSGSGSASTARVIFDDAGLENVFGDVTAENQSPRATVPTVDVPSVSRKSVLTIAGTVYFVMRVSDDGNGVTALELSRDAVR